MADKQERDNPPRWQRIAERLAPTGRGLVGSQTEAALAVLDEAYGGIECLRVAPGDSSQQWQVPPGWEVESARLYDPDGNIIADYSWHPLYLFTYSPPFEGEVELAELESHLLSDPGRPDVIPFHFSNQYRHWAAVWGFCLPHRIREQLSDGHYRVEIRTRFTESHLTVGHKVHAGQRLDSVLFVSHIDHPGQCADGLMGCLAGQEVMAGLAGQETRLTYRMLTTVEIVGTVFYARDHVSAHNVREALFLEMPGTDAPLVYARSARGQATVDRIMAHLLAHSSMPSRQVGFREAIGNDEIALDVAGVGVSCGSLMQWPYPHYHSNEDTPERINPEHFDIFVGLVQRLIEIFERNARLRPRFVGLPCLAHPDIDLYLTPPRDPDPEKEPNRVAARFLRHLPTVEDREAAVQNSVRLANLRNLLPALADSTTTILDLAESAGVPFRLVDVYTDLWVQAGLLEKTWYDPFCAETEWT